MSRPKLSFLTGQNTTFGHYVSVFYFLCHFILTLHQAQPISCHLKLQCQRFQTCISLNPLPNVWTNIGWIAVKSVIQLGMYIFGHWHNFHHFGSVQHHNGLEIKQSWCALSALSALILGYLHPNRVKGVGITTHCIHGLTFLRHYS